MPKCEVRADTQSGKWALRLHRPGTFAYLSDQEVLAGLQILTGTWGQMASALDLPMVGKDYTLGENFD